MEQRLSKIYKRYVSGKNFHGNDGFLAYSFKERNIIAKKHAHYATDKTYFGGSVCGYEVVVKPSTTLDSDAERQFNMLAAKWKKETGGYSTMIHKAINNNYLDIIGMGPVVIPFILRDLQKEPNHWHIALKHLTKDNPVPKEHLSKMEKIRQAWIQWGKQKNLI